MSVATERALRGYVHSVETMGAVDGPGLRYVVFMQGCLMGCVYCHNPDTWASRCGKPTTVDELVQRVVRFKPFFRSGGGVTVSGGEPLLQAEFVAELLRGCQEAGVHTALDTCGAFLNRHIERALEHTDLLLLDIKAPNPQVQRKLTLLEFSQSLNFLDHAAQRHKKIWIRHVVVPGFNDRLEHMDELGQLLANYPAIERVELLPLHHMGQQKWEEMGKPYPLKDVAPPTDDTMRALRQRLATHLPPGIPVL